MPDNEALPVSREWLSVQTEKSLPVEKINVQLLMLQTAYPTSTKNYSREEFQALQSLWLNIFGHVPEDVLDEAVRRFIINDRKGFFPSPGQIAGYVEQIAREREEQRREREWAEEIRRENERRRNSPPPLPEPEPEPPKFALTDEEYELVTKVYGQTLIDLCIANGEDFELEVFLQRAKITRL